LAGFKSCALLMGKAQMLARRWSHEAIQGRPDLSVVLRSEVRAIDLDRGKASGVSERGYCSSGVRKNHLRAAICIRAYGFAPDVVVHHYHPHPLFDKSLIRLDRFPH
jgi:hypothetical protein